MHMKLSSTIQKRWILDLLTVAGALVLLHPATAHGQVIFDFTGKRCQKQPANLTGCNKTTNYACDPRRNPSCPETSSFISCPRCGEDEPPPDPPGRTLECWLCDLVYQAQQQAAQLEFSGCVNSADIVAERRCSQWTEQMKNLMNPSLRVLGTDDASIAAAMTGISLAHNTCIRDERYSTSGSSTISFSRILQFFGISVGESHTFSSGLRNVCQADLNRADVSAETRVRQCRQERHCMVAIVRSSLLLLGSTNVPGNCRATHLDRIVRTFNAASRGKTWQARCRLDTFKM
jgi:hypothetical protein